MICMHLSVSHWDDGSCMHAIHPFMVNLGVYRFTVARGPAMGMKGAGIANSPCPIGNE